MVQQQPIAIRDDATSISTVERDFIVATTNTAIALTTRTDGRRPGDRRPVQLHLCRAENRASATILLGGGTRILCVVTGELVPPAQPDRPNEGSVTIAVDLSPAASTKYRYATPASTAGGQYHQSQPSVSADRTQKLASNHILRFLERCLVSRSGGSSTSSACLDTEALCVLPGQFVWRLIVNVTVLDDSGNLLDASVLASMAALRHYRKPCTTNDDGPPRLVPAHIKEPTPLPLHHIPLAFSFALFPIHDSGDDDDDDGDKKNMNPSKEQRVFDSTQIGKLIPHERKQRFLIDPTHREELCQAGRLTIALNVHHEICLLDFSGGCEVTVRDLQDCHQEAVRHVESLSLSLETSLTEADEQAQHERLVQLQQQKREQEQYELPPPVPPSSLSDEPAVPFYVHNNVQTTRLEEQDWVAAELDAEMAAREEAYRRQALDYNVGHLATRVRENDQNPSQKGKSSRLLTSMLQSVQKLGLNQADFMEDVAPYTDSITSTTAATSVSIPTTSSKKNESTPSHESLVKKGDMKEQLSIHSSLPTDSTSSKMDLIDSQNEDDDDEETTMLYQNEFQSVPDTKKVTLMNDIVNNNKSDDDDNVDLAAAIKTKKKKKGKK